MRSKDRALVVTKARSIGILPTYIMMAHRHLEKSNPDLLAGGPLPTRTYNIPVELLGVGNLIPQNMLDQIDSVELVYKAK